MQPVRIISSTAPIADTTPVTVAAKEYPWHALLVGTGDFVFRVNAVADNSPIVGTLWPGLTPIVISLAAGETISLAADAATEVSVSEMLLSS
jgi:hypothetical protein